MVFLHQLFLLTLTASRFVANIISLTGIAAGHPAELSQLLASSVQAHSSLSTCSWLSALLLAGLHRHSLMMNSAAQDTARIIL